MSEKSLPSIICREKPIAFKGFFSNRTIQRRSSVFSEQLCAMICGDLVLHNLPRVLAEAGFGAKVTTFQRDIIAVILLSIIFGDSKKLKFYDRFLALPDFSVDR